jgi:hypothetical protein
MPLTTVEQLSLLNSKVAMFELRQKRLEETLARIEERLVPQPPAPAKPTAAPPWAAQSDNVGMNATTPSTTSGGGHDPWGGYKRETRADGAVKDVSGQWRTPEGHLVDAATGLPIRGPERTPAHEQAVQLADKLFDKE